MTDNTTTNQLAFASLLAGGLLIIVGGLAGGMMMGALSGMMNYGMMGGYASYMTTSWFAGMAWWMTIIGLVMGGLVLYAAYRLRMTPHEKTLVGTIAIVAGLLSFLAMGGWILGGVLALLGGALALASNSAPASPPNEGAPR